ncbi:hypothetical protein [Frankia sp. QA3]|uniref:hypothetical protein n=1 Tax=Frankia sp. QA3 TaxID=710111 RepID=UPI00056C412A|nr:hypothetical protein [Frankia sp. QA3]
MDAELGGDVGEPPSFDVVLLAWPGGIDRGEDRASGWSAGLRDGRGWTVRAGRWGVVRWGGTGLVGPEFPAVHASGVDARPGDAGDPVEGWFPGDGFVDVAAAEDAFGAVVQVGVEWCGEITGEAGVAG